METPDRFVELYSRVVPHLYRSLFHYILTVFVAKFFAVKSIFREARLPTSLFGCRFSR